MMKLCLLLVLLLAACDKEPATPDQTPTLTLLRGDSQSDTISALLATPIAVRVTGPDGNGQTGVPVIFNVQEVACHASQASPCYPLGFSSTGATFLPTLTVLTGADGVAAANVRLGDVATTAIANVSVPLYNLVAGASITIAPGNFNSVTFTKPAADTILELGESIQLNAAALDRAGNRLPRAGLMIVSPMNAVTIDTAYKLKAVSYGTALIKGDRFSTDSMRVTVIPKARIAVSALHGPIRLSTLKGAAERVLMTGNVNAPDWSPLTGELVYVDDRGNGDYALSVMDTMGVTRQLPVPLSSTWPVFSKDGNWIYFFTQATSPQRIYRIHPNGTGLEYLMDGSFPAPAPDGFRMAAVVGDSIWVGSLVTGAGVRIPFWYLRANAMRWSPNGQAIAYRTDNTLVIMNPDGTGIFTRPAMRGGGFTWSPDGRWILMGSAAGGSLTLVDFTYVGTLQLPVSGTYPAWK